jgi:quinol monooxygenase YgiN
VRGPLTAYVVIAEFEVLPARLGDFLTLARGFAGECLSQEPGCRQFDVVVLEGTPAGVLFYEAFDDIAAFEAHGRASHLAVFKAAFRSLVVGERALRKGRRGPV